MSEILLHLMLVTAIGKVGEENIAEYTNKWMRLITLAFGSRKEHQISDQQIYISRTKVHEKMKRAIGTISLSHGSLGSQ